MKNTHARLILVLGIAVLLTSALAAAPRTPATAVSSHHGMELKGTVTALDEKTKVATIKDSAGKTQDIGWTQATTVTGGTLKVNEEVTVRYMAKGGKNVAASIVIAPAAAPAMASHKPASH
jgi:hypothetical protein